MILFIICLLVSFFSGLSKNLITAVLFGMLLMANHHPAGGGWIYLGAFLLGWLVIIYADQDAINNSSKEAKRG